MPSAATLVREFLGKKKKGTPVEKVVPHNSFRSLFDVKEISEEEKEKFSLELAPFFEVASEQEKRELFQATSELRSVQKQAVILVGERIFRVREMLREKKEGDFVFTKWLSLVFSSKKTAYNALALYEFFLELPDEGAREKVKTMPLKAIYILASRRGDVEKKRDLIDRFEGGPQELLIEEIKRTFPLPQQDKRNARKRGAGLVFELERLIRLVQNDAFAQNDLREAREKLIELKRLLEEREG
ncbi:MAG: hypothetical protein A3F09_06200 [Chlamydiae bacterium RIFCSPHIGHO2_12_FULL_49_11]|nr:MAG: hypothetical protein A3F09_06200 [Chlamydiae bacterium RIFCSPHIGHO2_12_FULL_49_11]